jgi:hypothetical protein
MYLSLAASYTKDLRTLCLHLIFLVVMIYVCFTTPRPVFLQLNGILVVRHHAHVAGYLDSAFDLTFGTGINELGVFMWCRANGSTPGCGMDGLGWRRREGSIDHVLRSDSTLI